MFNCSISLLFILIIYAFLEKPIQLGGYIECTDYISAGEGRPPSNECPGYDAQSFDGKAPDLDF